MTKDFCYFYSNPTFALFMKKVLVTCIDINYQLYFFLLYYIDKLKDSFNVYCYENVQNYKECSGNEVLGSLLDSYNFHLVVLCKGTSSEKSFLSCLS